jgi:hypothetical protein
MKFVIKTYLQHIIFFLICSDGRARTVLSDCELEQWVMGFVF